MPKLSPFMMVIVCFVIEFALISMNLLNFNLFTFLFSFGGIYCFILTLKYIYQLIDSQKWPHTEGEILESAVVEDGYSSFSGYTKIVYSYEIDGQLFKSDRIKFGPDLSSSDAQLSGKILRKYPKGKKFSVYYNPKSPTNAVLELGLNKEIMLLGFLAIILLSLALIFN